MSESGEKKRYFLLDPNQEMVGVVVGKTTFEALMNAPPGHGILLEQEDAAEVMNNILGNIEDNQ